MRRSLDRFSVFALANHRAGMSLENTQVYTVYSVIHWPAKYMNYVLVCGKKPRVESLWGLL